MNRRNFLTILNASLVTSACSSNASMKTLSTLMGSSFGNRTAFDADYPDKLPYASISVGQNGLTRSLLILGKAEGEELHWISADRGVLVTRHGRLVRTVGFTENLSRTEFSGEDFINGKKFPTLGKESPPARIIDLTPGNRFGIKIESSLEIAGNEVVQIGNRRHDTMRINEHCVAQLLHWKFTNSFWIDPHGRVWRSSQHFSPFRPALNIEVTKPYVS